MSVLLVVLGLILFVGLVVVHEFGHFFAARRNGVEIEEFGIGFPPRAFKKRMRGDYIFSINWLPLGGFVRLKGEHDADRESGSFGAASLAAKLKIMAAGVVMNLVAAFVLLTLLAFIGIPKLLDDQFTVANDTKVVRQEVLVGYIEPGSPAEKAGLQVRDQLIRFGSGENLCGAVEDCNDFIKNAKDLPEQTKAYAGQTETVVFERDGQEQEVKVTFRSAAEVEASKQTDEPKGYLGVAPTEYVLQRSTWSAPVVAAGLMKQFTVLTYKGLGSAVAALVSGDTGKATEQVAGPVGIFVLLSDGSLLGYQFVLMIIAIISLTLALINALPIPALDGGRLFVTLLFRALKRPLRPRLEDLIHGSGFMLLMLLFLLITIVDVRRFF